MNEMKATINAQGELHIVPESELECYALSRWAIENTKPQESEEPSLLGTNIDTRRMILHFDLSKEKPSCEN